MAARFLIELSALTGSSTYRDRARALLADLSKPSELEGQGRTVGEYLLALAEPDPATH